MMTDKEILEYRSDAIPDEILERMSHIGSLAHLLDRESDPIQLHKLRQEMKKQLTEAEDRTRFYYRKRVACFGIHNMRLKKLLNTFPEIFLAYGLTRNLPRE